MDKKIYKDADLAKLATVLAKANEMAGEDRKVNRDEGTCVLGAGVAVFYKGPRKRTTETKVLVRAPFQGNVGSWKVCKRALEYLVENGVDAFWYDGVMD